LRRLVYGLERDSILAIEMIMVGVIGASKADSTLCAVAEEVGEELASQGAAIVCGGLSGVMEAVCKGARKNDGITIGIIPSDRREDANPYVQIPIVTGIGMARNAIITRTADVVIAIGGQFGTLSEMGYALNMGKNVIALNSWRLEKASDRPIPNLIHVEGAREAVDAALNAIEAKE